MSSTYHSTQKKNCKYTLSNEKKVVSLQKKDVLRNVTYMNGETIISDSVSDSIQNDSSKRLSIADIEDLAAKVKELKNEHRHKRPIVIEFSGSPKSGKTTCIEALKSFLNRNGFKVKIAEERAGNCPVSDKLSPMFNIWTSCMSLAEMLGTLEDKKNTVDVLIFDRGIFDALCWFQLLDVSNKMNRQLKEYTEAFFLQKEFVQSIDIVFAFSATPEVSIKREYTKYTTRKRGRVMNEEVLQKYLFAINKTIESRKDEFRNIFQLDTSEITQDEVNQIVTETTLKTLKENLMENIGFFKRTESLMEVLSKNTFFDYAELESCLNADIISFNLRNNVENDNEALQPIPIAVIVNDKKEILVTKKNESIIEGGSKSPEDNRTLLYIGGHTRATDVISKAKESFLDICKSTLQREIKEELGISVSLDGNVPKVIYTPTDNKSKQHFAICFLVEINGKTKLNMDSSEFVPHKEGCELGVFLNSKDLSDEDLEDWSNLILSRYFD